MTVDRLPLALSYVADGLPVVPVIPLGKRPYPCLVPHGLREATTDPSVITGWWTACPEANVGVRVPDGHIVFDVDTEHAFDAFDILCREFGMPSETRTTESGSGWFHFWYRLPEGGPVPVRGKLDGITIRLPGKSQVVMPGSVVTQPDGTPGEYREFQPGTPIAELPQPLAELLSSPVVTAASEPALDAPFRPLADKWRRLIVTGDCSEYGQDRSRAIAALVIPCRDAGWTEDDFLSAITNPDNGISARYREREDERGQSHAINDVRWTWNRYVGQPSFASSRDPVAIREDYARARWDLLAYLDSSKTLRRTRGRTLAVWEAITDTGAWWLTTQPMLPLRDIALAAGIGNNSRVAESIGTITDSGVMTQVHGSNVDAGVYRLEKTGTDMSYRCSNSKSVPTFTHPRCPVASPPGLSTWRDTTGYGKGHWLTFGAVAGWNEPVSVSDIVDLTGQGRKTVAGHLTIQQSVGFVRMDSGLWIPGDVDPACRPIERASESIVTQSVRNGLDRRSYRDRGSPVVERKAA